MSGPPPGQVDGRQTVPPETRNNGVSGFASRDVLEGKVRPWIAQERAR